MPRIAAMAPGRSDQLGHGVVQHEAMSDVIMSTVTEHDRIEPSVISNPCVWSAGRSGVIRMDLPNPSDIANVASNNSINSSIEQVVSSRSTNTSGMTMSSDRYQNSLNAPFDQNSNSNLVTFPSPGPDSNSNWPISRHTIEHDNNTLNNSTDVNHNSNSDANGVLRSMNSGNFSWFSQRPQLFPIEEDGQSETVINQIQTSRRMTRAMRRRVTNDQRQDMELRHFVENATVMPTRPRRNVILTRSTRSSIPNLVSHPATARNSGRNSVSAPIRSRNLHSPLASLELSLDSAGSATNSTTSSPPKSVERSITRKRSATQANITTQSGTRKNTPSARNTEGGQLMSTRSQSSEKRKKPDDSKKIPAENDESKRCCICLEEPTKSEVSKLDTCLHIYCFTCIEKWAERENSCPLCKTRFHKIERVHKVPKPRGKKVPLKNVKKVKNRDQRSDYGRNMQWQGLLERMEAGGLHTHHFAQFIFSGFSLGTPNLMSFDANVPTQSGSGPYPSSISMRIPPRPRQHSTPQRASTSNNRPTFAEFATRSRSNNFPRVRSHHQTINDDVTRSLSALRSTLLNQHNESISSPSDTPGSRASFVDFQPPFTHGASEAFGVGDVDGDVDGDGSPRFNIDTSETFSGDFDSPIENNDDSEDGINPGLFYQRIRNLRRERNAVMERFHNGEASNFLRSSAVFERSAVDGLSDSNSNVFEDAVDRSLDVPRSFAANAHQADAGGTADTPLEIMDSDEDDGL